MGSPAPWRASKKYAKTVAAFKGQYRLYQQKEN
jgi:hypothetical protein